MTERAERPLGRHFLFLNGNYPGHVFPSLAIVAELVRRGHRVTYVTTEELAGAARESGAAVLCYEPRSNGLPSSGVHEWFLTEGYRSFVEDMASVIRVAEEALDDEPPEAVVYDETLSHLAYRLARKWQRPAARLMTIFAENEHYSAASRSFDGSAVDVRTMLTFRAKLAATLAELAISVPVDEFMIPPREELNLVMVPRAFQVAGETFDHRYVFVGPCTRESASPGGWSPPAGRQRLVLVSLGTSTAGAELFRTCVRAFTGLDWHVVLATGPRVAASELGELPPNVELRSWVPHREVLEHADVVVTHAGTGTVMESLARRVPLLTVPPPPQLPVAMRVTELGLGRLLEPSKVTAERVREHVLALADDQEVRARLALMAGEIADAGGSRRAADTLERLLGGEVR